MINKSSARRAICAAANKHSRSKRPLLNGEGRVLLPTFYSMRHFQRALFVCRQHQLVDDTTIQVAVWGGVR